MIDEIDQKLIRELQERGRKSYVEIGKKIGLVEGAVRRRVKRLLDDGVIKIVAEPNLLMLGYNFLAIMGIQVNIGALRNVADHLAKEPSVCFLSFVTGKYDLMAILITRSPQELQHFIEKVITLIPGIIRTESVVSLDVIKGGWGGLDTTELLANFGMYLTGEQRIKGKRTK